MNETPPSNSEDFQQELEILRALLRENLQKLKQDKFLGTQMEFWLESAKFLETDIEVWEEAGNMYERDRSIERMRKVLGILQQLIDRMNLDETGEDGA